LLHSDIARRSSLRHTSSIKTDWTPQGVASTECACRVLLPADVNRKFRRLENRRRGGTSHYKLYL